MAHVKTPEERGAIGAWAYEARDRLGLSVEQVIERLPTRYHPATLRKVEGGSAKAGRRMLRELADLYVSVGREARVAVLAPPGQKETDPSTKGEAGLIAAAIERAIDRQTVAIVEAVKEQAQATFRQGKTIRDLLEELAAYRHAQQGVVDMLAAALERGPDEGRAVGRGHELRGPAPSEAPAQ